MQHAVLKPVSLWKARAFKERPPHDLSPRHAVSLHRLHPARLMRMGAPIARFEIEITALREIRVRLGNAAHQLLDCARRKSVVRVHEHQIGGVAEPDSVVARVRHAAVLLMQHQHVFPRGKRVRKRRCAVRRSVIHHNQTKFVLGLLLQNRVYTLCQRRFSVVRRHDDVQLNLAFSLCRKPLCPNRAPARIRMRGLQHAHARVPVHLQRLVVSQNAGDGLNQPVNPCRPQAFLHQMHLHSWPFSPFPHPASVQPASG